MNEEQPQTPQEQTEEKQTAWNTVTPLSRILALILFIALPFVGFWLGYKYASVKVVEVERVVEVDKSVDDEAEVKEEITQEAAEDWKVAEVLVSPNGQFIAFKMRGGECGYIQIFDTETGITHNATDFDAHISWDEQNILTAKGLCGMCSTCDTYVSTSGTSPWLMEAVEKKTTLVKTKEEGFYTHYDGSITLSGYYRELYPESILGGIVCFFPDDSTSHLIPREDGDARKPWFCFEDQEQSKKTFEIDESVFVGESVQCIKGFAAITVSNYIVDRKESSVYDTAKLEEVLNSTSNLTYPNTECL